MNKTLIFLFLIFLVGCTGNVEVAQIPTFCQTGVHYHADIKVFIDDQELNLFKEENIEQDKFIHFHDEGNAIHFHKEGTLADFLNTVDYSEFEKCILFGYSYYFYVNGEPSDLDFSEYVVKDADKLLLKCGLKNPTVEQIESIKNLSESLSKEQTTEKCGEDK